jgi:hypothetical protein
MDKLLEYLMQMGAPPEAAAQLAMKLMPQRQSGSQDTEMAQGLAQQYSQGGMGNRREVRPNPAGGASVEAILAQRALDRRMADMRAMAMGAPESRLQDNYPGLRGNPDDAARYEDAQQRDQLNAEVSRNQRALEENRREYPRPIPGPRSYVAQSSGQAEAYERFLEMKRAMASAPSGRR